MGLSFFNTLTRHLDEFRPIRPGKAGLYSCGPTVYGFAHIGNLRTYLFIDLLKRTLLFNGFDVMHVMNVTDVGHLTSDADAGDDKVEIAARKEHKTAWEISRFYESIFKENLQDLGILPPTIWCRATEHIPEQIALIERLEKKGFTYRTPDGVYFDTSKFPTYGELARLDEAGLKPGARVDVGEKRNPTDFAVWKFSPAGQKRDMEWPSPWGVGFPGWHIECSAMSMRYLGETFDIHTGGIDHIPVHHANEIAQSEGATGHRFVNYWLHANFLLTRNEKMAKSAGEFLTLTSLKTRGIDPFAYRYLCLTAHYRSELNFTWESLAGASTAFQNLKNRAAELRADGAVDPAKVNGVRTALLSAVNDDLNAPEAVSLLWTTLRRSDLSDAEKRATLVDFDRILGLRLAEAKRAAAEVPDEVRALVERRESARQNKDWKTSDDLRRQIAELGYDVKDSKEGPRCVKRA